MEPDEDIFVKLKSSTAIDMADTAVHDDAHVNDSVRHSLHCINKATRLIQDCEQYSTPCKRTKQAVKPDPDSAGDEDAQTPSKKPKPSPGKRGGVLGPIPASYDDASHEDKTIMRMREGEGKSWVEIRKVLEDLTKAKIGASSLQIRYSRMKANFVVIQKGDVRLSMCLDIVLDDMLYYVLMGSRNLL